MRYSPRRRILSHLAHLPRPKRYVSSIGLAAANPDFSGRAHRAALVGNLEETEGCGHALPRQGVIHVALEGIGAIGRQRPIIGLALYAPK